MIDEENADLSADDIAQPNETGDSHEQIEEPSIEDRARRMGWSDEDSFRGPSHKWVPADEYVRRAEEEMPVLRSQLRRFEEIAARDESDKAHLKKELAAIRDDFKAFHEHSRNAEERAYARARAEIDQQMERSVEEADTEAFNAARQRLKQIEEDREAVQAAQRKPEPEPEAGQQNGAANVSPTIQTWVSRNQWFNESAMLQGAMIEANADVQRDMPGLSEAERLEEAAFRVRKLFPDRFGREPAQQQQQTQTNTRRSDPAAVSRPSGNGRSTTRKQKTFDDLPEEAKREYARFAARIPNYSKEDYLKSYQF